jgi:hypothetical protein
MPGRRIADYRAGDGGRLKDEGKRDGQEWERPGMTRMMLPKASEEMIADAGALARLADTVGSDRCQPANDREYAPGNRPGRMTHWGMGGGLKGLP